MVALVFTKPLRGPAEAHFGVSISPKFGFLTAQSEAEWSLGRVHA